MPQVNFDSTQLPALKARTQCVVIPRDPDSIYAYWDYTKKDIDRARRSLKLKNEELQIILRIHDLSHDHSWDLNVGASARNQYIQVDHDNAQYSVELGITAEGRQFFSLKGSNMARTPPKTSSMRTDLIWQDIRTHKESQPFIKEEINAPLKKDLPKAKLSRKAKRHYLSARDIRESYIELFARYSSKGKKKGQTKFSTIEDILKERLKGHSLQKNRSLLGLSDYKKYLQPGSLMQARGGASEGLVLPTSVNAKQNKFFFEIWTELIVHGRTEADATVRLDQNEIKLNPDGTFSLRYAFPDGKIPLDFTARSSNGMEHRHIYSRVERETKNG